MKLLRLIVPSLLIAVGLLFFNVDGTRANEGSTLEIPAIGVSTPILSAPFVDGTWDVTHLHWTVAHLEMLPWFNTPTNVALGGHSTDVNGNPDIFYNLHLLQAGDEIFVHVDGQVKRYIVDHLTNVAETDIHVLHPTTHEQLTLFTCDLGSYSEETGWYTRRTVVVAYPA
ncbi:MAG: sortase [Chloroflexota bacterium]